jgi:hypothetical protein
MLAVSGEQMVFAQFDFDVKWSGHNGSPTPSEGGKVIPRSLATTATPKRLMYLEEMTKACHKMAVATIEMKEERAPPNAYRTMRSSIILVSVYDKDAAEDVEIKDEGGSSSIPDRLVTAEFKLKNYERVYSMIEWTYIDDRHEHHFIFVGTGITEGPGQETGRRLFFRVGKSGLKLQKESAYKDGPVRCMALYDSKKLVTIIGKTLKMEEYSPSEAK